MAFTSGNIAGAIGAVAGIGKSAYDFTNSDAQINDLVGAIGTGIEAATALFADEYEDDWRVRLTIPSAFIKSTIMAPLKNAGGCIFPYTPDITFGNSASYTPFNPIHSNYEFQAYKNSKPKPITINAPMNVETTVEAAYWVAMLHYFRSATKMFTGKDNASRAGSPPPIVLLNGYGGYMFKNIPVVITDFSLSLSKDCDYIPANIPGNLLGSIMGITDSISSVSDALGTSFDSISDATNTISGISDAVGAGAGILQTLGLNIRSGSNATFVPATSQFQVTLQPVYSREHMLKFSLDNFAKGGYLNNSFGYA
jgi:hypothetical protein